MAKYHINSKGVPAICRAEKGRCPFGGEGDHYDSPEQAQAAADEKFKSENSLLAQKKADLIPESELRKEFPQLTPKQFEQVKNYYNLERDLMDETIDLKTSSSEYMGTDEYFDRVQEARKLALEKYKAKREVEEFADKETLAKVLEPKLPEREPYNRGKKPEATPENFHEPGSVISAYTGKSLDEVKKDVENLSAEKGISFHEATMEYWKKSERRTDKPIISVDLETANPRDATLNYDNGQLTYIIEYGAVKSYPDGRIEEKSFLRSIPADFNESHHTGFTEVHNINYEDIKNEVEFTEDEKTQKEMMEFMDGSVIMAHNASFEKKQLTNSLRGFRKEVNNGNIEMLDTLQFSRYFVRKNQRNSNKDLVEASGQEYSGAHRAHNDAQMTWSAFNILKREQENE